MSWPTVVLRLSQADVERAEQLMPTLEAQDGVLVSGPVTRATVVRWAILHGETTTMHRPAGTVRLAVRVPHRWIVQMRRKAGIRNLAGHLRARLSAGLDLLSEIDPPTDPLKYPVTN